MTLPGADARSALIRLCAAGFVAYCSYAICRTPLLPLFARELGAGLTVCGAAVLLVSIATSVSELVTAIVAYAAGVATTTAATSAYITDVTRRARYGAAHGVFGTIYDVGDALGPILAGILVAAVGYTRMFQVMAAVALTMAVAFGVASRIALSGRVVERT